MFNRPARPISPHIAKYLPENIQARFDKAEERVKPIFEKYFVTLAFGGLKLKEGETLTPEHQADIQNFREVEKEKKHLERISRLHAHADQRPTFG